jgi:hypothetical protein
LTGERHRTTKQAGQGLNHGGSAEKDVQWLQRGLRHTCEADQARPMGFSMCQLSVWGVRTLSMQDGERSGMSGVGQ